MSHLRLLIASALAAGLLAATPLHSRTARVHTPPAGSAERKAIVQGLRESQGQDRVYVIRRLRVLGDWALITVDPQSRDGAQRYERETVVLHFETGIWVITGHMCIEDDLRADGSCDRVKSKKRLLTSIYGLPAALFP